MRLLKVFVALLVSWPAGRALAQPKPEWTVWERTSPCVDARLEWMTVAKENPTPHGPSAHVVAAGYRTTSDFADAMAQADVLRTGERFSSVCCRDWSVWKQSQTGKLSILKGMGNAGFGWAIEAGSLCCEEAAARAGLTGMCPGGAGGAGGAAAGGGRPAGYLGCFKDPQTPFDLDGYLERSQTKNTPERCIKICRDKGFAYAGVQWSESCLCGNSYGKSGPMNNCTMKCTGNRKQICGGYGSNDVYSTGAGK